MKGCEGMDGCVRLSSLPTMFILKISKVVKKREKIISIEGNENSNKCKPYYSRHLPDRTSAIGRLQKIKNKSSGMKNNSLTSWCMQQWLEVESNELILGMLGSLLWVFSSPTTTLLILLLQSRSLLLWSLTSILLLSWVCVKVVDGESDSLNPLHRKELSMLDCI